SHARCHIAWSDHRTKQSIRFAPQLTQFGALRRLPPRLSQPPHWVPFHQRCNIAWPERAKQSMRFSPQLTQLGASMTFPPRLSQWLHWARACWGKRPKKRNRANKQIRYRASRCWALQSMPWIDTRGWIDPAPYPTHVQDRIVFPSPRRTRQLAERSYW